MELRNTRGNSYKFYRLFVRMQVRLNGVSLEIDLCDIRRLISDASHRDGADRFVRRLRADLQESPHWEYYLPQVLYAVGLTPTSRAEAAALKALIDGILAGAVIFTPMSQWGRISTIGQIKPLSEPLVGANLKSAIRLASGLCLDKSREKAIKGYEYVPSPCDMIGSRIAVGSPSPDLTPPEVTSLRKYLDEVAARQAAEEAEATQQALSKASQVLTSVDDQTSSWLI